MLKNAVLETNETAHTLLEYVRKNKVKYEWIVEIEFMDKIPKSPAGKILRRMLRERKAEPVKTSELQEGKHGVQLIVTD